MSDLAKVQQQGCALEHIKQQTLEICMTAVQQNGYALQFVKDQTLEICMAAVQENGYVLCFVKQNNFDDDIYFNLCVIALHIAPFIHAKIVTDYDRKIELLNLPLELVDKVRFYKAKGCKSAKNKYLDGKIENIIP